MFEFLVVCFVLWLIWKMLNPARRKWRAEWDEEQRVESEKATERAEWFRKIGRKA